MLQNDVIFAYFVTADKFGRLENSIDEQIKIGIGLSSQSFLVSDKIPPDISSTIVDYFCGRIITSDPYVIDENNKKLFSFSKLRNSAIKAARETKASWMYFCDADTVFTSVSLPGDGNYLSVPDVYWQKAADESLDQSILEIKSNGKAAFSQGNSWYVLHRTVFEAFDFNEQIFGYGWEDLEFFIRVQAEGFSLGSCDTCVVHMYHSQEERDVNWLQFYRNKSIFEAVQIELENNYSPDWKNSEQIKTSHPAWATELYFDYTNSIVVNPLSKTANRFEIDKERIIIRWNDWPAEIFQRDLEKLLYVEPESAK